MRILIADKDINFINIIKEEFGKKQYEVDSCDNGIDAKEYLSEKTYQAVILKSNLSGIDGISIAKYIKQNKSGVFTIIKNDKYDSFLEAYSYKCGANDFIVDTMDPLVLVNKLINLFSLNDNHMLKVGVLDINIDSRILLVDGKEKNVTLKEFELLIYLIKNKGKAVSREQIFKDVWGYENFSTDDRTIDTHIKMLRNELGEYKKYIETLRGFGYKFEVR